MSLIELAAMIAIGGMLLSGVVEVLHHLQRWRQADTVAGIRVDWACTQLRRDLAAGVPRMEGDGLGIVVRGTEIRWRCAGGELLRDGRPMAAASTLTVTRDGGWLGVTFTPPGLPARRVEAPLPGAQP